MSKTASSSVAGAAASCRVTAGFVQQTQRDAKQQPWLNGQSNSPSAPAYKYLQHAEALWHAIAGLDPRTFIHRGRSVSNVVSELVPRQAWRQPTLVICTRRQAAPWRTGSASKLIARPIPRRRHGSGYGPTVTHIINFPLVHRTAHHSE